MFSVLFGFLLLQAVTDGDVAARTVGLDERGIRLSIRFLLLVLILCTEFDEAFRVFSSSGGSDSRSIAKTNSVLVPFLKSDLSACCVPLVKMPLKILGPWVSKTTWMFWSRASKV